MPIKDMWQSCYANQKDYGKKLSLFMRLCLCYLRLDVPHCLLLLFKLNQIKLAKVASQLTFGSSF